MDKQELQQKLRSFVSSMVHVTCIKNDIRISKYGLDQFSAEERAKVLMILKQDNYVDTYGHELDLAKGYSYFRCNGTQVFVHRKGV
jgi:hypothetical protein